MGSIRLHERLLERFVKPLVLREAILQIGIKQPEVQESRRHRSTRAPNS